MEKSRGSYAKGGAGYYWTSGSYRSHHWGNSSAAPRLSGDRVTQSGSGISEP